jgi:hypothetical protein
MVHAYNSEAEAQGLRAQGQPGLHMRPYLKKKKKKKPIQSFCD